MQAVSYLAPALAPLAIKIIDKWIFDDQPSSVPQIIQIPASPQCACCCRHQSRIADGYDSTDETCSTCAPKLSSSRSSKHRLSTKSSVRSSSTSDSYGKHKVDKDSTMSKRRLSDSSAAKYDKMLDKDNGNTLAVLAGHLKREISHRQSKDKTSSSGSTSYSSKKCSKSIGESRKSSTQKSERNSEKLRSSKGKCGC